MKDMFDIILEQSLANAEMQIKKQINELDLQFKEDLKRYRSMVEEGKAQRERMDELMGQINKLGVDSK